MECCAWALGRFTNRQDLSIYTGLNSRRHLGNQHALDGYRPYFLPSLHIAKCWRRNMHVHSHHTASLRSLGSVRTGSHYPPRDLCLRAYGQRTEIYLRWQAEPKTTLGYCMSTTSAWCHQHFQALIWAFPTLVEGCLANCNWKVPLSYSTVSLWLPSFSLYATLTHCGPLGRPIDMGSSIMYSCERSGKRDCALWCRQSGIYLLTLRNRYLALLQVYTIPCLDWVVWIELIELPECDWKYCRPWCLWRCRWRGRRLGHEV